MSGVFSKRDVRLMLFIGSAVLLVMQLPAYFAQNGNRDWQSRFSVSQSELAWLSASTLLEHHRLQETLWRYVNGQEGADKTELLESLHSYMKRFDTLGELIEGHLQQLEGLEGLEERADIESSVFELSVKDLQASGVPTLRRVEKRVAGLAPGDHESLFLVHNELGDLSERVTRFLLGGFDFSRQLNREQIELTNRLNQRLWFSQFSIIYGVLLVGVALFFYLREKQQSSRTLERANRRLEMKIDESERLARELEKRANHDGLSGLLNRRGFNQELERLLDGGRGQHGLCFVDIDMFKVVNDTSGHSAGDALIKTIAALLNERIGEAGAVARFGGDEFLILMPDCERPRFELLVIDVCDELRRLAFGHGGQRFDVSGSFGAVHFDASEQSMQSLMAIVDAECYEAKRAGGARVHFHGEDDSVVQARRSEVKLLGEIQHALNNDGFTLFRQPIRTLRPDTGSALHGWEVLLRMRGDDGEFVPPQKILNVAERFSFAPRIDRWVVSHAFEWLNALPDEFEHVDCLNINLSGRSVGDSEFLDFLELQTASLAVETNRVCFEITETVAAGKGAHAFILRLKELGYQLALDDFGSGFSSFGYLESLPVDYIKIDGLFVRDIDTATTHREFVRAISAVGKAMGKAVVAEFVSNDESVDILRRLGVDYVQGYHVGHPAPLPVAPRRDERESSSDPASETLLLGSDTQAA